VSNPAIDPYLARAMQQALPPDNAIRVGTLYANDGGSVRVQINGGVVQAGYLQSYVPQVGDTVAVVRQDAGWLVFGSLYGDAAPATTNPFADEWHFATLQSGWTNRVGAFPAFQYRLFPNPRNVQIMGQIVPGTLTDNTLITTLPTEYRPAAETLFSARKAPGAYCLFALQPDGTIRIYDAAGGNPIQILPVIIPLDTI